MLKLGIGRLMLNPWALTQDTKLKCCPMVIWMCCIMETLLVARSNPARAIACTLSIFCNKLILVILEIF